MENTNRKQAEQEIRGGVSLWDRITNDPKFINLKREIQARYGLPLNYDIRIHDREWSRWLGNDEEQTSRIAKRGQAFLREIHALFKKFEIPEAWYDDLVAEIAGCPYDASLQTESSPRFDIYRDAQGNWKWQCVITPDTDLTNPMNLDLIKAQQKIWAGNPPKPVTDPNNPRRLDWGSVYDWHKKHPLFTVAEIASKIGYSTGWVRRKFAEIETKE